MPLKEFSQRIEWKFHLAIWFFSLSTSLMAVVTGALNMASSGTICTSAPSPPGCTINPRVFGECDAEVTHIAKLFTSMSSVVAFLSIAGIVASTTFISWRVIQIFRKRHQVEKLMENRPKDCTISTNHGTSSPSQSTPRNKNRQQQDEKKIKQKKDNGCHDSHNCGRKDAHLSERTRPSIEKNKNDNQNSKPSYLNTEPGTIQTGRVQGRVQGQPSISALSESSINTPTPKLRNNGDCAGDAAELGTNAGNGIETPNLLPTQESLMQTHQESASHPDQWNHLVRETVIQTMLYVLAFLLTYVPILVYRNFIGYAGHPPTIILWILHGLFPLGGLFNILVYTRAPMASVKRLRPDYSWWKTFYMVLKAGGEVPGRLKRTDREEKRQNRRLVRGGREGAYGNNSQMVFRSIPYGHNSDRSFNSESFDRECFYAGSESMSEDNICFLSEKDWRKVSLSSKSLRSGMGEGEGEGEKEEHEDQDNGRGRHYYPISFNEVDSKAGFLFDESNASHECKLRSSSPVSRSAVQDQGKRLQAYLDQYDNEQRDVKLDIVASAKAYTSVERLRDTVDQVDQ